jgi:hypothetical protein
MTWHTFPVIVMTGLVFMMAKYPAFIYLRGIKANFQGEIAYYTI